MNTDHIKIILTFLDRVPLKGNEAEAMVAVKQVLMSQLKVQQLPPAPTEPPSV